MIYNLISALSINLLCRFPVSTARRWIHRNADEKLPQEGTSAGEKQILVDVSTIIQHDARTGIQRVVRALLLQLLAHPPVGWRVRPVYATRKQGYHYAPDHFGRSQVQPVDLNGTTSVRVKPGDLFLGLDLAAHIMPQHRAELAHWKRTGVKIHIVVYDLLPVLHPYWFNRNNTKNIRRWLRTIAIFADGCICISNTVKNDLADWLRDKYSLAPGSVLINTIPLGANIEASAPSSGLPENIHVLLNSIFASKTMLMVGTLEPRKGHDQTLTAFEGLWRKNREINLVIVGKPGWKTEALQLKLNAHPLRDTRLYWLIDASDELLEILYARCTGVIVASHAEGFGLSLIEAMHHQKPVFVRDIPTFREVGGDSVAFFPPTGCFEKDLEKWLAGIRDEQHTGSVSQTTWEYSAGILLQHLGFEQKDAAEDSLTQSCGSLSVKVQAEY